MDFHFVSTDPFETQNRVAFLSSDERLQLHNTLEELKVCRGRGCTLARSGISSDFVINFPRGIKRKHNATGEYTHFPLTLIEFNKSVKCCPVHFPSDRCNGTRRTKEAKNDKVCIEKKCYRV